MIFFFVAILTNLLACPCWPLLHLPFWPPCEGGPKILVAAPYTLTLVTPKPLNPWWPLNPRMPHGLSALFAQVSVNMLQGMVVTATALTGINTYAVCYLIPAGGRACPA